MAQRTKTSRPQLGLRVSKDMQIRLAKVAEKNGRSINAEVTARVEQSFEIETRFGGPLAASLVEAMGRAMAAVGECDGYYKFGRTGHNREWLNYQIPYDRAAAAAIAILKINRPKIDGAVPGRAAVAAIERTGVEAVEQSAAEIELQAQRAADDGPEPSTEPAAMWDRARRRVAVEYGRTPAAEAGAPEELREKIRRTYEDLGALLAALEATSTEEKT